MFTVILILKNLGGHLLNLPFQIGRAVISPLRPPNEHTVKLDVEVSHGNPEHYQKIEPDNKRPLMDRLIDSLRYKNKVVEEPSKSVGAASHVQERQGLISNNGHETAIEIPADLTGQISVHRPLSSGVGPTSSRLGGVSQDSGGKTGGRT